MSSKGESMNPLTNLTISSNSHSRRISKRKPMKMKEIRTYSSFNCPKRFSTQLSSIAQVQVSSFIPYDNLITDTPLGRNFDG